MLWFDAAMMRSLDPGFQIAENEVDHRQMCFCLVGIAIERQCLMAVPQFGKPFISRPSVGANDGTGRDVFFGETNKCSGASIWYDAKPQAPGIDTAPLSLAIILVRPNFDGADYDSLVVSAAPFSARFTANKAFVYFYRMIASNGITLGANHARAEFMENLKGRLIAAKRKLALELNGGLSWRLRGHQIRAPKPCRKRCVARLHDGASRKRCVGFASPASQHYRGSRLEPIRLLNKPAFRAPKTIWPTNRFKVTGASRVIGEYPLEFRKGSREAAYVHVPEYSNSQHVCQATG